MVSPIASAKKSYRSLKRIGFRNLSQEDRGWYFTYRSFRNYTKLWNKYVKEDLIEALDNSLVKASNTLEDWKEFEDWAKARKPRGHSGGWNSIMRKISEDVECLSDRIDDFNIPEDSLDSLEVIKEDIIETVDPIGLVPSDTYEDDGCLWFDHPESGKQFFLALGRLHGRFAPIHAVAGFSLQYRVTNQGFNWENYPQVDLHPLVVGKKVADYRHPSYNLQAYFGAYNSADISEGVKTESVERALNKLKYINRKD